MRIRSLIAVAAVAMLALSGCSFSFGTGGIDTQKVEDEVAKGVQEQLGVTVTVSCPDDVPLQAGATFECTATDENGETAPVTVTQKDNEGNVTWELDNSQNGGAGELNMAKVVEEIETGIADQLGFTVVADCPASVKIENGKSFTCQVTDADGGTGVVQVVMTDDTGSIQWELVQETATS